MTFKVILQIDISLLLRQQHRVEIIQNVNIFNVQCTSQEITERKIDF